MTTLALGGFNLTDPLGSTFGTAVMAQGTSRGAPVPLEAAVRSWLQDGSIVVTQGYDNRTVTLRVRLEGPTLAAVSDAEGALFAELGKPNTLTWTPPEGPSSVFVVITSSMDPDDQFDQADVMEANHNIRIYNVRLVCEAFVRSDTEVITSALAASGGTGPTNVDAGSSTSGWSGTINGVSSSPAVVSGAVGITSSSVTGTTLLSLTRTGAVTTSTSKYLVVDYKPTVGSFVRSYISQPFAAFGDGVPLTLVASQVLSSGVLRVTYFVAATSVAVLRFDLTVRSKTSGGSDSGSAQVRTFFIDNIDKTDVRPSTGTTRQTARTLSIEGSARTQGSLTVSHATNALGDTLVYVWSDPENEAALYSPAFRQYYAPTGAADAATVFGTQLTLPAGAFFSSDVPMTAVPQGRYVMLVRCSTVSGSFTGSLVGSTKTQIAGTNLDSEYFAPAASVALTTAYGVYPVCRLTLPTVDVRDPSTATVRVALQNTSASSIKLDEVWLFNLSLGELVWVQCGTGTAASGGPSRRLYIDPPTVDRPRPVVLRGHATDGSDAFHASVKSWGRPSFVPPRSNLFVVTTNTADADTSFRYWPTWHSNAAL